MMPGTHGKPRMRHTCPPCGHVFVAEGVDQLVHMCIEHACTFHDVDLLKRFTVEELRETIQRENENYWVHIAHLIPDDEVTTLIDEALCDREREIVQYLVHGYSNKRIAGRLCISERTVSTHLVNIYDKLGVHSRAELTSMIRASDRIVEAALRLDEARHGGPFVGTKSR